MGGDHTWEGTCLDWERINRVHSFLLQGDEWTAPQIARKLGESDVNRVWSDCRRLVEEDLAFVRFTRGVHLWMSA